MFKCPCRTLYNLQVNPSCEFSMRESVEDAAVEVGITAVYVGDLDSIILGQGHPFCEFSHHGTLGCVAVYVGCDVHVIAEVPVHLGDFGVLYQELTLQSDFPSYGSGEVVGFHRGS